MHELQALSRPERPAFRQHQVVNILQANAGNFAEDVERIEHFLKIDQPDFPRSGLLVDDRFQRGGGGSMASSGIEVDEINLLHECFIAPSSGYDARALKR